MIENNISYSPSVSLYRKAAGYVEIPNNPFPLLINGCYIHYELCDKLIIDMPISLFNRIKNVEVFLHLKSITDFLDKFNLYMYDNKIISYKYHSIDAVHEIIKELFQLEIKCKDAMFNNYKAFYTVPCDLLSGIWGVFKFVGVQVLAANLLSLATVEFVTNGYSYYCVFLICAYSILLMYVIGFFWLMFTDKLFRG